mgnify:CR=1 FL=1
MKINKIVYKIILLIMLVMIINPSVCFANAAHRNQMMLNDGGGGTSNTSTTVQGDAGQNLPTLDDSFKPSVTLGSAESIINSILGILTVVGIIAFVVGIALIGLGSILGSAGEKAEAQTKLVGVVIAGLIMIGGSTIAKFIISIAENIS